MLPLFAHPQLEEAWLDDEHSEFLEQLKMEMLEEQQREEMELAALQEEQENEQVRTETRRQIKKHQIYFYFFYLPSSVKAKTLVTRCSY